MAVYTPLSNNASTISPSSKLEDISLNRLEKVFVVNAIGSVASRLGSVNEYIYYACVLRELLTLLQKV